MKNSHENGTEITNVEHSEDKNKDGCEEMSSSMSTSSLIPNVDLLTALPVQPERNKDEELATNSEMLICSVTLENCENKLMKNNKVIFFMYFRSRFIKPQLHLVHVACRNAWRRNPYHTFSKGLI